MNKIECIDFYNSTLIGKPLIKIETRFPEFYYGVLRNTSQLHDNASLAERIWVLINNTITLCATCSTPTLWNKAKHAYSTYCNSVCSNNNTITKEKRMATMTERYGVPHALQSSELLSKSQDTLNHNYGVTSPLRNNEINKRRRDTNVSKYGKEETFQIVEFCNKRHITLNNRYNVDNVSQIPAVKEKVRQTNIAKFGTSTPFNSEEYRKKFKQRTGFDTSSQELNLSKKTYDTLQNKDMLYHMHYTELLSFQEIAIILDCSDVTVGNYFKLHDMPARNNGISAAQQRIVDYIRSIYDGDILVSDRTILNGKELDIVIPDKKLAIEYCGVFWHSNKFLNKKYHESKMQLTNEKGYRLITIFEDEWIYKQNIVKSTIANILNVATNKKIYARNTFIKVIKNVAEVKKFLLQYHIQGYVSASLNIGLIYENMLVALVSIRKRGEELELVRYASVGRVQGGFSKLIKYIRKEYPQYSKISTFADLRWSVGSLYNISGFVEVKKIPPDYSYVYGNKRYHKFNFRHSKLKNIKGYDCNLSEALNTQNMNIHRIYDCGKIKYETNT